jgi:RND family efflux transporter MFP subunit
MNVKKIMTMVWKPVAGVVGLAALVIWSAGMLESKVEPGQLAAETGFPVPADVTPVVVKLAPAAARVEVVGTVASEQRINLSSRMSATIREVLVSAGDGVTNGQLLVALDDRELREQLSGAEAQFKQAEAEFKRATLLFEKEATTEQARMAAEAGYQGAKARVEQVRVMMEYTRIVSPIDGVVADRRIEAGDLAGPGQVLLAVYDMRRMRLEVPVPVRLVSRFSLSQKVNLRLDGWNDPVLGVVQEIVSEVEPMTRTQVIKVSIGARSSKLLPGGYGSLVVEGDVRQTLWVPVSAVYRVGQLEYVQVVVKGGAFRRTVKTGVVQGDQVEILSGLDDGDAVLPVPVMKEG